jgi:hypothetical protein
VCFGISNHQKRFKITKLEIISHTLNIFNHIHIETDPMLIYLNKWAYSWLRFQTKEKGLHDIYRITFCKRHLLKTNLSEKNE